MNKVGGCLQRSGFDCKSISASTGIPEKRLEEIHRDGGAFPYEINAIAACLGVRIQDLCGSVQGASPIVNDQRRKEVIEMGKPGTFTDKQREQVVQEYENGARVADLMKKYQISDATFYTWKKKFGRQQRGTTPGIQEKPLVKSAAVESRMAQEIKHLRDENTKLKIKFAEAILELEGNDG